MKISRFVLQKVPALVPKIFSVEAVNLSGRLTLSGSPAHKSKNC
jgi:hypothetical protein